MYNRKLKVYAKDRERNVKREGKLTKLNMRIEKVNKNNTHME